MMSLLRGFSKLMPVGNQIVDLVPFLGRSTSQNIITQRNVSTAPYQSSRGNKIDTNLMEANLNLPTKPKKPITPWLAFVRDRKDQVLREKAGMTAAELTSILSKDWKMADKSSYEDEYKRKHEQYMRQVQQYEDSLTDEHRDYLNSQKASKREKKAMKELKKTNIPILPRNCANLFVHERCKHSDIKEQLLERKPSDVFRDLFEEYRNLTDEGKRKYIELQEEDKSRYQHEFLEWYESVQNNDELSRSARELADTMLTRVKSLNYV